MTTKTISALSPFELDEAIRQACKREDNTGLSMDADPEIQFSISRSDDNAYTGTVYAAMLIWNAR